MPAAKDSGWADSGNGHGSTKASGNASTSEVDIAAVMTFTEPRSFEPASFGAFCARRMIRASGTIAQTYTAQNTSAYGQTNGGGIILSGSASSARARPAASAARTAVGAPAVPRGSSVLPPPFRFRFGAGALIRFPREIGRAHV